MTVPPDPARTLTELTVALPEPGDVPAVVAFGGGHGLSATLSALSQITNRLTAVVTVADDGGSSGRLRAEFPALLPPGDLRMALSALAGDTPEARRWTDVLQHRFAGDGPLGGHAVGNLLLTGLWETTGSTVAGLDALGRLLGARGRVLPMSTVPLQIEADVELPTDGELGAGTVVVVGQHAVATTGGRVLSVRLRPDQPPACPEALAAVAAADWVLLGPGSLFTSVVPHLLLGEVRDALLHSRTRIAYVLNLAAQPGETDGFSPARHLEALFAHAPWLELSLVIADAGSAHLTGPGGPEHQELAEVVAAHGARLVTAALAAAGFGDRHDPDALAAVLRAELGPGSPAVRTGSGPMDGAGREPAAGEDHRLASGTADSRIFPFRAVLHDQAPCTRASHNQAPGYQVPDPQQTPEALWRR